jgi:hypothetical protein
MHSRGRKFALLLLAGMVALGVVAFAWGIGTRSSEAQQDAMQNCPQPGKWAISVWSGDDATDADDAFATCDEGGVAVAYSIDPATQQWSRWFADRPDLNTLTTIDDMQGVLALGGTAAPATPVLPAGWTKIEPGGDTTCSLGTPYAFFVHPGTVNRLAVYFQGGGGCWDAASCSIPGTFDETVTDSDNPENFPEGIGDSDNPDNPFKDWFGVFIPYCTADFHWGDSTQTYMIGGEETTFYHKGFVNVSAVVDWIGDNFEKPEKIFVSGCSAGSGGSIIGAAHIHKLYPDVPLYQLGDSLAGVGTEDVLQAIASNWNPAESLPDWIPALQVPWTDLTMADLYIAVANYYPNDRWAQYNTAHDETQTLGYLMQGGTGDWSDLMLASIQEIQDGASNFHSYTAPGAIHCVTPYDIFYSREVEGVKFRDWVNSMVNDQAWDDVMCTDCETDPEAP